MSRPPGPHVDQPELDERGERIPDGIRMPQCAVAAEQRGLAGGVPLPARTRAEIAPDPLGQRSQIPALERDEARERDLVLGPRQVEPAVCRVGPQPAGLVGVLGRIENDQVRLGRQRACRERGVVDDDDARPAPGPSHALVERPAGATDPADHGQFHADALRVQDVVEHAAPPRHVGDHDRDAGVGARQRGDPHERGTAAAVVVDRARGPRRLRCDGIRERDRDAPPDLGQGHPRGAGEIAGRRAGRRWSRRPQHGLQAVDAHPRAHQPLVPLDPQRDVHIHTLAVSELVQAVAVAEADRPQVRPTTVQAHVQVAPPLAHQAGRFGRAGRHEQTRLRVAAAVGRERLEGLRGLEGELPRADDRVDRADPRALEHRPQRCGRREELAAERGDLVGRQLQADGARVTAPAGEAPRCPAEQVVEVQPRQTAAGALGDLVVACKHEGGTIEMVDQA